MDLTPEQIAEYRVHLAARKAAKKQARQDAIAAKIQKYLEDNALKVAADKEQKVRWQETHGVRWERESQAQQQAFAEPDVSDSSCANDGDAQAKRERCACGKMAMPGSSYCYSCRD